jgi:hypothetical protein
VRCLRGHDRPCHEQPHAPTHRSPIAILKQALRHQIDAEFSCKSLLARASKGFFNKNKLRDLPRVGRPQNRLGSGPLPSREDTRCIDAAAPLCRTINTSVAGLAPDRPVLEDAAPGCRACAMAGARNRILPPARRRCCPAFYSFRRRPGPAPLRGPGKSGTQLHRPKACREDKHEQA